MWHMEDNYAKVKGPMLFEWAWECPSQVKVNDKPMKFHEIES